MRRFWLLVFVFLLSACDSDLQQCSVLKINDGDTIVADCNSQLTRIRMLGIDAPELSQEPWGLKSKEFTATKLKPNQIIYLDFEADHYDKYGRTLAYIFWNAKSLEEPKVNDLVLLNAELLANGLAQIYLWPNNRKYSTLLKSAEAQARDKQINIWNPTSGLKESPYQYRKKHKHD